jgi:acyl carrier protein
MRRTDELSPVIESLLELPRSERRDALEELVVNEFREALMMTDDEDFGTDVGFFDLGCTSLLILDIRKRLEAMLGYSISATVLFNRPTVERLIEHLTDDVLDDVFSHGKEA